MRKLTLIVLCLICLSLHAETFRKTYHRAPLIEVLRDIEKHFSCSFMYRPQDLANAPAVTGSFSTDDYTVVLKKALGNQFVYTVRKNICVITPVPQKQEVKAPESVSSAQKEFVQKDTIQPEPNYEPVKTVQSDARIMISPQKSVHIKRSGKVPPTRLHKSHYHKHSFYTALSLGYGSELYTGISAQYAWFFKPHWGVSLGLEVAYAKFFDAYAIHIENSDQVVRIGFPIYIHTQWQLSSTWGIHANAGTNIYAYNNMMGDMRFSVIAGLHATRWIDKHVQLQLGLYTNYILLHSPDLWSVGVQLGFQIGK